MKKLSGTFSILILLLCVFKSQADPIIYKGGSKLIGSKVYILEDKTNSLTPQQAYSSNQFLKSEQAVQNFDISNSTFWIKFTVENISNSQLLFLEVGNALVDTSELFHIKNNTITSIAKYGTAYPYNARKYKYPTFIYNLDPTINTTTEYLLKIKSSEQAVIPLIIANTIGLTDSQNIKDIITGGFIGLILVMIFYNLFIFISIRDRSYLYYILYLLFIGITQITLSGYTYKLFFPNSPYFFNLSIILFASFAGVTAILFIRRFLNTKDNHRKWDKILLAVAAAYVVAAALRLANLDQVSSRVVDLAALIGSILVYVLVIQLMLKGHRPAKFIFLAWTIFLAGLVMFVLRNLSVLPYNDFTNYTLQFGIAAQVAILSIALADKINILQNESRRSQKLALDASRENERIVREQNIILEENVKTRTLELQKTNDDLEKTLVDLKEAEMQLVESEKMSSLGQLTAGIAHEINNPINFVTSNVTPLRRDISVLQEILSQVEGIGLENTDINEKKKKIEDIKQEADYDYLLTEIDYLLKGIDDGASRTAEIVKGLRIFSRLDEDDIKRADINECLDSTLVIVNNLLNGKIAIEKNYGDMPLVECYPGKLNQVFLNIMTNAIHAIHERWVGGSEGKLTITTSNDENAVNIGIKDNGTGMTEETKKKLFEPFFTTKEVGVGTGLGLSIAWNTIKKHNGTIKVISEVGNGTEFIISIPIHYIDSQNT